uniref:Sushi domain-containing protein n=1 Tax=Cyprinus carpio TaxID=7962 RepID=A0A8C2FF35_CYPCA
MFSMVHVLFEAPTCVEIFCSPPKPIKNGFVEGRDHKFGVTIFYSCFPGFLLVGNNHLTCEEHGWSSAEPKCIFLHGSLVQYHCHSGYEMKAPTSVCLANGSWSEAPPKCLPANCGQPPVIENGRVTGTDYGYNSMVTYACDIGYILTGNPTLICRADGLWDDPPPRCDIVTCDPPEDISHGYLNGSSFNFDDVVEYICFPGYEINGSPVLRCACGVQEYPSAPE